MEQDPNGWQQAVDNIPLKRPGRPIDYAGITVLLASDNASWITGTVIPCDGGMTISWQ